MCKHCTGGKGVVVVVAEVVEVVEEVMTRRVCVSLRVCACVHACMSDKHRFAGTLLFDNYLHHQSCCDNIQRVCKKRCCPPCHAA